MHRHLYRYTNRKSSDTTHMTYAHFLLLLLNYKVIAYFANDMIDIHILIESDLANDDM